MTTKFSRRTRIQPTPWPCKRSPPCLPEPDPTDEQLLISVTILWKQPPFGPWPHPGWYYIDTFNIILVGAGTRWWQGESTETTDGHIFTDLRWRPIQQQHRIGFQFHPNIHLAIKHAISIFFDLPEPPFCVGPLETTDDEEIGKIVASLTAPV